MALVALSKNKPTMDFVYNYGRPQGEFEQATANQGWKWMRTNTIDATRRADLRPRRQRCLRPPQHRQPGRQHGPQRYERHRVRRVPPPRQAHRRVRTLRLRRCQGRVDFNPEGKARPNKQRGEKSIVDASHVYPLIPEDFLAALSERLEQEWRRPSWWERNMWTMISLVVAVAFAYYVYCIGKFIVLIS
ncbi:hypothetical protein F5B22DRAFT_367767 [Xylaria bambusicola]|uniref:uncharacterized protein n=1 Tax=Xylaria bambusicola TaxID=326684 RepID=UPI0020073149|nr:uncharacterized protein F5B22DRAFT_367767 [Xylaria bambusicola]KAI0509240.1 hypothetical protein F5B22DRAFT_367767 [Xylaria bambusicola]